MDDESGGLFSIALSDSETEETSKAAPRDRTGQTLEEWQEIKATYRAKVENGEVSSPQREFLLENSSFSKLKSGKG